MRVVLAQPRGFCAGVERAIEIVERALEKYGPPIYVRHEIVHNRHVVERLRAKGAQFRRRDRRGAAGRGDDLQRPRRRERDRAPGRRARPAGHRRHLPAGLQGAYRGPALCQPGARDHPDRACRPSRDRGHDGPHHRPGAPDLAARGGRAARRSPIPTSSPSSPRRRLSVDDTRAVIEALKARFPSIVGPDTKDICYATQNRQRAARELAKIVDVVLVVGAPNSSNSNRLREIAAECGVPSYLIEDARALDPRLARRGDLGRHHRRRLGPETLVEELIERLREMTEVELEVLPGVTENVRFRMPPQLADSPVAAPDPQSSSTRICRGHPAAPEDPCRRLCHWAAICAASERYPLVLMLEPLFRCNLACAGCGKIDYPDAILNQRLSVDECLEAVDECGAPIVVDRRRRAAAAPRDRRRSSRASSPARNSSICAPTRCCSRRRSTCSSPTRFSPGPSISTATARTTTARSARAASTTGRSRRSASPKRRGFRVNINATLFDTAEPERIARFFDDGDRNGHRRHHRIARLRL